MNGEYQPIEIIKADDDTYHGRSDVLGLELRWEQGRLLWYDPARRQYLQTYEEEVEARHTAEVRSQEAEARAKEAEARAQKAEAERQQEQEARLATEARYQQMQAELERLRRQDDKSTT